MDPVVIEVRVTPNSSRSRLEGLRDGRYGIRLQAVPEDGRANRALIQLLAEALGIKRSSIALVAGAKTRLKRLEIHGLPSDLVEARLLAAASPSR